MLSRLRSLLTALLRFRSLNEEIDEELRFHCAARTEDLLRRGMTRSAAERQARIELGAAAAHREEIRASHGLRLFDYFRQEFGQALRTLRRNPAFSLSIVGLIALGVGSNVAVFNVVDAVLFRPLPFAKPERLVDIKGAGSRNGWISLPEYQTLETRSDLFTGTAAYVRDLVTFAPTATEASRQKPCGEPSGQSTPISLFPGLRRWKQSYRTPSGGRAFRLGPSPFSA